MPVPHLNIRIVQRSKGNSAVAGAAYQAGEKLFSEYDQKHKDHRRKQHEVVYTEIMLPTNAPPEYADRATLWNSAEEVEKQWNSQLARRFVVALPREVPLEMCPQMMQEYCREHFVSKGMCCDFAIHDPDPPGHNPHCHIMLTMRAIDENGKWMPKSRKVYDLDENGERIKLPSGRWKSHKEDTVDWNEQYHAEEWRHGWEVIVPGWKCSSSPLPRSALLTRCWSGADLNRMAILTKTVFRLSTIFPPRTPFMPSAQQSATSAAKSCAPWSGQSKRPSVAETMKGASMNMSSNLNYTQTGDYLLPNLTLHQPKTPLGKYGRMRLNFLKQQHPVLYHTMFLNGSLYPTLTELEQTVAAMKEQMMADLLAKNPAPDKEKNQMAWVQHMNSLREQVEEVIQTELIYS